MLISILLSTANTTAVNNRIAVEIMQKTLSAKILLRECLNWLLCYVPAEIADNTFSPIMFVISNYR